LFASADIAIGAVARAMEPTKAVSSVFIAFSVAVLRIFAAHRRNFTPDVCAKN
jgi:hypothetical protein